MRHRLIGFLLCFAGPAAADGVTLLESGLFCASPRTEESRPAPDTVEGVVHEMQSGPFDVAGQVVPLVPGLAFGIRFRSDLTKDRVVRMVTLHPPLGPEGQTRSSWETVLQAGAVRARAFSFDHAYELVPGTWTMEVWEGSEVLLSVPFAVTTAPVSAVDGICGTVIG